MMCKNLVNLYDQLKPDERVRMFIEAGARGDFTERGRLIASCPVRNYRAMDADFDGGKDAAFFVTLVMLVDLRPDLRSICTVQSAGAIIDPLIKDNGDAPHTTDSPAVEAFAETFIFVLRRAKSTWVAWEAFCKETWGLDGLTVVRGHLGEMADEIGRLVAQCDGIEPDGEEAKQYAQNLREIWVKRAT